MLVLVFNPILIKLNPSVVFKTIEPLLNLATSYTENNLDQMVCLVPNLHFPVAVTAINRKSRQVNGLELLSPPDGVQFM